MTGGAGEDLVGVLVTMRILLLPRARLLDAQPGRSALRLRWWWRHDGRSDVATTRMEAAGTGAGSVGSTARVAAHSRQQGRSGGTGCRYTVLWSVNCLS